MTTANPVVHAFHTPGRPQMMPDFDTPIHHNPAAHIEPSNVRGSAVDDPFGPDFTLVDHDFDQTQSLRTATTTSDNVAPRRESTPPLEAPAYAMLTFPDCVLYIRCTEFDLGRDEPFYRTYKAKLKRERRAERRLGQGRGSESLDGRPEPGAPSTYSEHGGAVGYDDPEVLEEALPPAKKRRLQVLSQASSAKSIAPASLNLADLQENDASSTTEDFVEFVPIHPPLESDITRISRKHLHFVLKDDVWVMYVTGNGAYVDEEYYEKDVEKTRPIAIKSGAEIRVCTLLMQFHPANVEEDPASSSPLLSSEPISEAESDQSSPAGDDDDEMEDAVGDGSPVSARNGHTKTKIKLKIRRRSDEKAGEPETVKKRKAPEDGFSEERDEQGGAPNQSEMADDSLLANDSQLPAPRKGPGRPPKNGSFSKRDSTAMKRKEKEYLAKGLPVPDVAELLEIVRREQKENDAKKKARTNDMAPMDVRPSIEPLVGGDQNGAFTDSQQKLEPPTGSSNDVPASTITPAMPKERSQSPVKPKEECDENELKKPMDTYPVLIDIVLSTEPNRTADLQRIYHLMEKRWPYYRHCTEGKGWQSSVRHNLRDNKHFKNAGKSGKGWFWTINDEVPLDSKKNKRAPSPSHLAQSQMQNRAGMNGMPAMPHHGGQWNGNNGQIGGGYNNYAPPGMIPGREYGPNGPPAQTRPMAANGHRPNGLQPQGPGSGQVPQPPGNHGGNGPPGAHGSQPPRQPPSERETTPPPYDPLGSLINEIVTYRVTWFRSEGNQGRSNDELSEIFRHATEHFSNDLHNLQNYMLSEQVAGTELALNLKRIFDERGSFGKAYYIRQAMGPNLRHVQGNMPDMPLGPPRDGLVYPAMTAEEIQDYTAKGVGQAEYENALRLAEEATRQRQAELARFRAERAARAARAQQFVQQPQAQHINRAPQNGPAGNVAAQHSANRYAGPNNGLPPNAVPQNSSPPNATLQNGPPPNAMLQNGPPPNITPQTGPPANGVPQSQTPVNGVPQSSVPSNSLPPLPYAPQQSNQAPHVVSDNSHPQTLNQAQTPAQPLPASSAPGNAGGATATTSSTPSSGVQPQRTNSTTQMVTPGQAMPNGQQTAAGSVTMNTSAQGVATNTAPQVRPAIVQETPAQPGLIKAESNPSPSLDVVAPPYQTTASTTNTTPAVGTTGPVGASSTQAAPASVIAPVQASLTDEKPAGSEVGTS
jgi:hypothetical protein